MVLGHADVRQYLTDRFFLGATLGRVAGRIGRARFELDGQRYLLPANDGAHHLHGGPQGFHTRDWAVLDHDDGATPQVLLGLTSPSGDSGYPGRLDVTASFRIDADALAIDLVAGSDATTPVSLTSHPYFNLSGDPGRPVAGHVLSIQARSILAVDADLIPTGEQRAVDRTPFDFREPGVLPGTVLPAHPQLERAGGYDHSFVLDPARTQDACLYHPDSGLSLTLSSNQASLQFYTGQHLSRTAGSRWQAGCGLCLEPQQLPDAINQPGFASPLLRPGERYHNRMRFQFHADR